MPIAAVAAPSIARRTQAKKADKTDKTNKTDKKSAAEDVFVNPPTSARATETSVSLPGPIPAPAPEPLAPPLPGPVTATMTGVLTPTANNVDAKADPGDTINYTAILTNTGSDPTGLISFNDFIDSHTTFVPGPGAIKSTPVCFDQIGINAVSTNEDIAKAITLTGQDPDGDSITFSIVTPPANGGFGATTAPNLTYTPNANFSGSDSFTFRVNDGTTSGSGNNGNSNETCTVSITVVGVNDAPTFTVPGNPAAVNEDAVAQNVAFITPASIRPAQSGNTTEDAQTVSFVITNNTNPGLFSSAPALNVVGASYPKTANLTFTPAANQNGTATITYHAHDTGGTANGGVDNSADQTFTITVNAVNDPPVVVAPAAFPVQANMKRTGLTGLLGNVNDNADNGVNGCSSTTFTVTSGSISATSPAGGIVSNVNLGTGTFDFEPPPGFTGGNVTFTYTVSDTGCPGVGISAPVTVTVAVSGTVIWFVNPAAGVNGTGTLASPFNLLASANTAMGVNVGQRIFVYTGTTTSGVGVTLTTSQWLIGQGAIGTDFDTFMGITPPANTIARPTISTTGTSAANRPTIQGKVAMNGSNTRVQGINITPPANTQGLTATNGSAPGVGTALTGLQLGASPTSDVIVSTTGASGSNAMGVSLTNAGGNFNFISVTTNGGLGISADTIGSGSTMNFGPVSISNRSGTGVFINNAQGTITFGATTIPNPADAGGYGIRIDNSSATVTIPSATISDPHTVTAQTDADTNLIPDNDGDGDAIFLKNNTGSFTLSGGTLSNCGNDCIDGRTVQAITLTNVTINTPGQETGGQGAGGHGISFIDLSGTSNLTGLLITQFLRSQVDGFRTINTNKNAAVNVINCRFENSAAAGASDGNDGLFFEGRGTSNMTTVVDEASPDATHFSRFQGLFGDGIQISTGAVSSGKMTTTVKNTDFKDAYQGLTQTGSGNNGLRIAGVGGGKHAVDIQNNTFLNVNKPLFAQGVISLFINDNSEVKGTIAGNTITNATQAGIQVFADNAAGQTITDMDLIIQNNTMDNISSQGIFVSIPVTGGTLAGCDFRILNNNIGQTTPVGDGEVLFGFGGGPNSSAEGILFSTRGTAKTCNLKVANNNVKINANGVNAAFPPANEVLQLSVSESATLNATVQNNQLLQLDDFNNGAAFFGQSFGAGTPNVCLDFTGNTGNTSIDFFLQKAAGGSFVIENVANVVAANTGVWSPANPSASGYANSAGCAEPPVGITRLWVPDRGQKDYLAARPETPLQNSRAESLVAFLDIKTDFSSIFGSFLSGTQSAPTVLPAGNPQPALNSASENGTGFRTLFTQATAAVDMARADLNPARVEQASSSNTKAHPQSAIAPSSLHATVNDERVAKASSEKELRDQKSDLRSNHAKSVKTGVRGQESATRSHASMASRSFAPMPVVGGAFPVNGTGAGFILPAGKSTTIKFSVTLNNPPNLTGPTVAGCASAACVANHGTLSGSFSNNPIDTNTVATDVDLFDTTVAVASSQNPSFVGQNVQFTATVSSAGGVPTGSVQFKDGGAALGAPIALTTGGTCPVGNNACATTPNISSLTAGSHVITAEYTDSNGNFDSNTGTLAPNQQVNNKTATTTTVLSSLNPSNVGDAVTFTAQVNSASATGTVQFWDGPSGTGTALGGAISLTTGGSCPGATACASTAAISNLTAGNHTITADYSGDVQFNSSTGKLLPDPPGQQVNKKATTTTLTSTPNPSNLGESVTFTATVVGAGGTPTGFVQFKDNGVNLGAAQPLNGSGIATLATSSLTAGNHTPITADYLGDAQFAISTGTLSPSPTQVVNTCAASVVVDSTGDVGGVGTELREAITAVCAGGTITFDTAGVFATPQTITLTAGELSIAKSLTIDAPDAAGNHVTITAAGASRVFKIQPTFTATIRDLTITGGNAVHGGGIYNDHGTLTVLNVTLTGNTAPSAAGGAIYNDGQTSGSATLNVTNSTLNTNTAAGGTGGAIYNNGIDASAIVNITGSTLNGNSAANGGAICNEANATGSATLNVTNSTISGNLADTNGGGILNFGTTTTATATLTSVTVTGNHADNNDDASGTGGGIHVVVGTTFTLKNTIVAGNLKGSSLLQVETATVAETVPNVLVAGDAKVIVTAAGMTGSPETVNVPVALNDDEATVAGKIRAGLAANTHVNDFFTVSGAGTAVILTARTAAANDTSMNIDISDGTSVGLAAAPTSADTTPGRSADDISGTVDATSSFNLIGDAASSGGLTEPNANHNLVGISGAGNRHIATILNSTLADNGGPTKTHALVSGSAALETGDGFGLTTDQRGFPRPVNSDSAAPPSTGNDSDIGAFEKQIAPGPPGTPNLDAVSDSGTNSADDKTNVTTNLSFTIPGVTSGATVQLFRDGALVASGLAAGATIQLVDPGPLTFDADGTTYSYTAKQLFGADTSVASAALPVLITIIPDAPVLDPASDSGTLGDNTTNDTSPTFNIANVVNGATVELLRNGAPIGGGVTGVAAGTTIQLTDPSVSNGTFTYTARQTFNAITSDASAGTAITITIKPNAPDLIAASDSGPSNTDNYTNDTTPTFDLSGIIVGAKVELLRDNVVVATDPSAAGTTIQLSDPGTTAGVRVYEVQQTVGVTLSPKSDPLSVTIDTVSDQPSTPDLLSTSDSNINNDDVTNDNTPTFSGTAEANSAVQLFATGVLKGSTTADGSGNWSITSSALADGPYNITAVATDQAGNVSLASAALPVVIDTASPTVVMSSAVGNPTATTPIPVTVTFNQAVTGFVIGDIVPGNGTTGNFAGGPAVYTFDLTPTSPGAVSADIAAGVAIDLAGNANTAATQFNRTYDPSALSVTITPVSPDPRNTSVSSIQIVFNKAVTGFDLPDLSLKRNGGAELLPGAATLTSGDNITWTLGNLSGLTGTAGTYVLLLTAAGSNIKDAALNSLTSDATESWVTDTTPPDVTINQAAGQTDPVTGPSATTVVNFTAIFTEPVVAGSFTNADVTISGTAGATVVNISEIAPNDGTHFNVAIGGMTQSGTVIVTIAAGVAQDAAGNGNTASTSTDNTVTFNKNDSSTLEVNSVADTDDGFCTALGSGPGVNQDCTLREAINAANADAGAETITFNSTVFAVPGPYTINLGSVLPDITTDMTITGPGAKVLTVKRNVAGPFRIFFIGNNATASISDMTVTNGFANKGGGVFVNPGTLTLTRVAVTGNTANGNEAGGGIAVEVLSTLNVIESTINGNHATAFPGGGGGIFNNGGTLSVVNSTISGNDINNGAGGGIFAIGGGSTTLTSSTITGNTAQGGGGFAIGGGGHPVTLKNTIIAGNTGTFSPDINGTVQSDGFNLIQSTSGATINQNPGAGPNITGQDPQLNALADNGGPTKTHSLQCTSPAIDKGKAFGLTTDQRGGVRPFDLADGIYPNAAGGDGSDIGAVEVQTGGGCQPVAVPPNPQPSTNEDTPVVITLKGTYSQNFALTFTITQSPSHGTLGPISAPVCNFNLSETCTATVTYTPAANFNGLDSFKFKVSAGGLDSDEADVNVTVIAVNDPPVANGDVLSNIAEDSGVRTIPFTDLLANDSPGPPDETGQTLTVISVSNPVGGTVSILGTNVLFTPTANYHGPASFQYKIRDNGTTNGAPDPKDSVAAANVNFTIDPVADTPSVTNATTNEDTQTSSGLVISRNAADGAEVTHFKITSITNGTLFKNDGVTPIPNNSFITFAEGNAGLKFTPGANLFSPTTTFSFQIQASLNNTDAGLGGGLATATITVNAVADTPSVTNATTTVNIQTASGLVISRNPADSAEVTHFKITSIQNGTLFKNDGTTQINNNDFITFAEGNAGLKFTPANNLSSPATTFSFDVQASTSSADAGLGGSIATATITVNCGGTIVTNSNDSGAGSLRAIILSACPGSTITFDMTPGNVTSPINLTSGQLLIDKSLTIQGPGANLLTVQRSLAGGTPDFGIFNTQSGTVAISGLTVSNGNVGGGIFNSGTLTLTNSTVSGNKSSAFGGGVFNQNSGTLTLTNSTVSGNTASSGGGIFNQSGGTLTLTNSTVSGNGSGGVGGGIVNGGTLTLTNNTVSGNTAGGVGGGIFNSGGTVTLHNTIVAGNFQGAGAAANDIVGNTVDSSSSFNLIGTGGSGGLTNGVNNNLVGVADARLAPLANNGGPTQTHALLAGSPALDAGNNAAVTNPPFSGVAPFTDQRGTGFSRIVDGPDADTTDTVDIGAFEAQVSVEDITDKATNEDTQLQFTFNVGGAASITGVTATSSNTALVPNNVGNIALTGAGSTRTLTINPLADQFGASTITITVNGTNSQSMTDTFELTVNSANDAPSFTKGADQTVNEDASAQSVPNWATNLSAGPANEPGQTLTFLVTGNTNPGLFSAAPAISPTGTLTYTPAANASGSAIITIVLKDNGGTANGGQDTSAPQTFTITINAVNDAPVNHVPGAQNIPLNASFVFSAGTSNAIFISDVDAGSDPVQVTLKATDGTITLNGTSGLSFTVGDGTDDPLMIFTGSLASINAALEGMKNLAFGSGVITITTNDLGHNGTGGPLSDTDTIQVTVVDNLAPQLLTIPGTDRAIAFDSVTFVVDPFSLVGSNNFTADHRTHITLFALHAQLRPGETASAITAEADVSGTVVPLIVESVMTVPNFDWLTQIVVKFPDGFSTGGGGPHDAKIRIRLRGQDSNQAVIIIVPAPRP